MMTNSQIKKLVGSMEQGEKIHIIPTSERLSLVWDLACELLSQGIELVLDTNRLDLIVICERVVK